LICRQDLSATAAFIHDMKLDGMVHARVVRQPNRGGNIGNIDEGRHQKSGQRTGRTRPQRQFPRHRRQ